MTLASWFSAMRHSRRLTRTGASRNRSRAFNRRASFDALEDRRLLSATVSFTGHGETLNESAGTFSIPVTVSGTPDGTPTVTPFASGFSGPFALAVDAAGYVYVANKFAGTVMKVPPGGGVGSPFATGLTNPDGLAFDAAGNLYVADGATNAVDIVPPGGGVAKPFVTGFNEPFGLAFDTAGNLYVANCGSDGTGTTVSMVPRGSGTQSPYATGLAGPDSLAFDDAGNLYVANLDNGTVSIVPPGGGTAKTFATLAPPAQLPGLAFDSAGNLYVAEISSQTVYRVSSGGKPIPFASDSSFVGGMAVANGSIYVGNVNNGTVSQITDNLHVPFELAGTARSGVDYSGITASPLTFGIGQTTEDITGTLLSDPGPSQTLTLILDAPTGGAVVGSPSVNTLTITEPAVVKFGTGSETVSETTGTFSIPVTVAGTLSGAPNVSPFASGFNSPDSVAFDAAGNFYVTNAGDGTVSEVSPAGKVSLFASGFKLPAGVAVDGAGSVYVADIGAGAVYKVPKANATPITVASGLDGPVGLAFDSAGNLYVADSLNNTVDEVPAADGTPTTFATGFNGPVGLAFDPAGNLYVANLDDGTVSEVAKAGGTPSPFASGFNNPIGLAFDSAGNLYVADSENNTVDEVTPTAVVSTFASGCDGPAGLALVAGRMYVTDGGDDTMSQVTQTLAVPFALGGTAAAGVAYSGLTAGVLTFGIGQTTADITGTLLSDPGAAQTLTFTLGTPAGGAVLGNFSANTLTISEPASPTPTQLAPVFIGEQRVFSGKGKHKKLVGFEFLFNGALNAGSVQSTGNYHVTQKNGKKAKVLRVKSAVYNPGNFSVTISAAGFNTAKPTQVTIAGLEGAEGAVIPQFESRL